ncbi:MAG: hypothetical protein AAB477_03220 [Patescibacteria group bacterium]
MKKQHAEAFTGLSPGNSPHFNYFIFGAHQKIDQAAANAGSGTSTCIT